MPRSNALPHNLPPRGLCREAVAQYIGISATKFDQMVSDGRMPHAVKIDGRKVWDRCAIDLAFNNLGGPSEEVEEANEWDNAT